MRECCVAAGLDILNCKTRAPTEEFQRLANLTKEPFQPLGAYLARAADVSAGHDGTEERYDFSGFISRPTQWQSSLYPIHRPLVFRYRTRIAMRQEKPSRPGDR